MHWLLYKATLTSFRLGLALAIALALGCGDAGSSRSALDNAPPPEDSARQSYRLVSVGGEALPTRAQAATEGCSERPYYSEYVLTTGQWRVTDSAFVNCERADMAAPLVRRDSGTYRLVADTISLFVADTMIGAKGLVLMGLFRDDSLVLWGSDLDGGNYLYVRILRHRDGSSTPAPQN
jgi:hypothetical protein